MGNSSIKILLHNPISPQEYKFSHKPTDEPTLRRRLSGMQEIQTCLVKEIKLRQIVTFKIVWCD